MKASEAGNSNHMQARTVPFLTRNGTVEPVVGRAAIEQLHRDTFAGGPLTCTPINLVVDGDWGALEWIDPDGFRGCGFFCVRDGKIAHQRGYWDSAQLKVIHPDVHYR